jgi:hypothetical protein
VVGPKSGDFGYTKSVAMKQDLNVYTVMLILAFLATVIGCLFLFLEMRAYEMQKTVPADLRAPTTLPSGPVAMASLFDDVLA